MLKGMNIRKITDPKEYSIALFIRREVFIEEQQVPSELEIDTLQGENFLIWEGEEAAGTARYQVKEGLVKFERVAVLKAHRSKGLGKALMLAMQEEAERQYPDHLQVMQAQMSAIPFYEKIGWVAIGAIFLDAEIEHMWMVLPPRNSQSLICRSNPNTPVEIKQYLDDFR